MYKSLWKRVLDCLSALIGLVVLLPIVLLIICLIKLDSKGSVLFKQKRIGLNNKEFCIYKFRTMLVDTPQNTATHLLDNPEKYITKVGRFLRKTSLDELPQLVNILKGEMSVIGPRPALWNQEDLINKRENYNIHTIRPGLTGWAQVNGRDELSIEDKVEMDLEYFEKMSFSFDSLCMVKTIKCVLTKEGVLDDTASIIEKKPLNR